MQLGLVEWLDGVPIKPQRRKRRVDTPFTLAGAFEAGLKRSNGLEDVPVRYLESWLKDSEVQQYIRINRHQGILWYNRESFDEFLWWMHVLGILRLMEQGRDSHAGIAGETLRVFQIINTFRQAEEQSGYQVENLLDAARETEAT